MSYQEIGEFLSHFNSTSYNRSQIGNDKTTIAKIYDFLKRLNLSKSDIEQLINNISYLRKEDINLPLFLEILSRTLGYIEDYKLSTIIKITKQTHDIYYRDVPDITIDDYIHLIEIDRIKKLFLSKNMKHKTFNLNYIADIKFASAIALETKDYQEFMSYLENPNTSILQSFTMYIKLRTKLPEEAKLYWDLYFGEEYLVLLNKASIPFEDIFQKNTYRRKKKVEIEPIQLDLFTYEDTSKEELELDNYTIFQFSSMYESKDIPDLESEKELLSYYNNLIEGKKYVVLPKYKGYSNNKYIFNTK